jgi:hypothetical protein
MTLAAILVVCFLSLGAPILDALSPGSGPGVGESATRAQDQNSAATPQSQTAPAQGSNPGPASPTNQPPNSPSPAKPSTKKTRHRKKDSVPNCSDSPATSSPADSGKPNAATAKGSTNPGSGNAQTGPSDATGSSTVAARPCPPPKVVIKNGGSDEPTVELKGGTSEPQASQQRLSTEQLTAATEENLKKTAERQLNPSQQETVNQTKQFMDQAKSAVAAGDVERGHNLAKKAYLLSEELLKP